MLNFRQFMNEKVEGVRWDRPNLADEVGEYLENSYTKKYFKKRGIDLNTSAGVIDFLSKGKLVPMTKEELSTKYNNITLDDADFENELSDKDYRKSYDSMQSAKKLPAPIIVKFSDGTYYGFAGNRRMNTAFRKGIPLKVWLVNA